MNIVSLSGRLGCGKTTIAKELINNGFTKIGFADYMKNAISNFFKIDISFFINPELKNKKFSSPIIWNNKIAKKFAKSLFINDPIFSQSKELSSPREMMQFIGTNVLRTYDDNFHVKRTIQNLNDGDYIFDDCRFINELDSLTEINALNIFIIRPYDLNISNHDSETSLKWKSFENIIVNDSTVDSMVEHYYAIREKKYKLHLFQSEDAFYEPTKQFAYYAGLLFCASFLNKKDDNSFDLLINHIHDSKIISGLKSMLKTTDKISSPFVLENLKHWNLQLYQFPDIIKTNEELIQFWLTGIVDAKRDLNLKKKFKFRIPKELDYLFEDITYCNDNESLATM